MDKKNGEYIKPKHAQWCLLDKVKPYLTSVPPCMDRESTRSDSSGEYARHVGLLSPRDHHSLNSCACTNRTELIKLEIASNWK